MTQPLPPSLVEIASKRGLYADRDQVMYVTNCGTLLINHAILNHAGHLILSMSVATTAPDSCIISNECISDPITEEQALAVIDRWAKIQEFEHTLDAEPRYKI